MSAELPPRQRWQPPEASANPPTPAPPPPAGAAPVPAPPQPAAGPASAGGFAGPPPYGPGGAGPAWQLAPAGGLPPYPMAPRTSGTAIGALVVALVGLFLGWMLCGLGTPIAGVVAIVMARSARRTIRLSGGWETGHGVAVAAEVIGWFDIAITILAVIFFAALIAIGIAAGASGSTQIYSHSTCLGC